MFIKAAINGGTPSTVAAVPITPQQIALDVKRTRAAGADVVHFHARTGTGAQSIAPALLAQTITEIRSAAPDVMIGTTTGLWCTNGPTDRLEQIKNWTILPDFASVAFCEEGAAETAQLILDRGMILESAVWSVDDIPALLASRDTLEANVRVLIEPMDDDADGAVEHAREIAARLLAAGVKCPLLYHGEGDTVWPVLRAALTDGHQIRIGFEDGLLLPDGSPADSNVALIQAARQEARLLKLRR
ncbi:3-keto-5-aminohexanoate cleavage protein [Allobranchiibius huperziae]|uniref:Uncharacterized protein (DUF849 family) n=1 Tax=Allobranchiibius huperziae TaxID=1874116 RepID=A0A853DNI7_9MICO|nr:3-keto-5-aminohexanoate cleavage protein [Allobranchiibius huperziae]NYJ76564.1 uncharacterized protein (DUF849 family) [Allobranchiibius huperziae]